MSYYYPPPLFPLQDSSSGNTSDMENQEGGGGHGHKFKGKEGNHRHSASHKPATGYKVEDKTTWTLLQQKQQYCTPPPPIFTIYILHPFCHPSLLSSLSLTSTCCQLFSCGDFVDRQHVRHRATLWGSFFPFFYFYNYCVVPCVPMHVAKQ